MGNKTGKDKKKNVSQIKNENKLNKNKKKETNMINSYTMNVKIELTEVLSLNSYARYWLDNTFCLFESINKILYLIFTNVDNSIISYNLIDNKIINEIKNAHCETITNYRYFFDKINYRDLVISISCDDNNIKLWNVDTFECLLNIINIYEYGWLNSAFISNYNNQNYIIASNCNNELEILNSQCIRVFDFSGKMIKEINNSKNRTFFIDSYYDKKLSKNFILTGNDGFCMSYDYELNKIYHKYLIKFTLDRTKYCMSIVIDDSKEIIRLIESIDSIQIWNFHSGQLLQKINFDDWTYSICLWNPNYLFVGCKNANIKFIDLKNKKIVKNIIAHKEKVLTIKKFDHFKYGEFLITQDSDDNNIKLWRIKIGE